MMRRNHVSMHDLEEDMRLHAHIGDLSKFDSHAWNAAGTSALSRSRNNTR